MPRIANSIFESVPFCRTESEYTEMALKDIILPITQFGENNLGVNDIDIALGDAFTSNMKSYKEKKISIAIPIYDHNIYAQTAIPILNGQRLSEYLFS